MTHTRLRWWLATAIVVVGWTTLAMAQRGIAVVVNSNNSQSGVTMAELRKLVSGEKRYWPDGSPVKLFTRNSGTAEHDAMLKLLGMSETEYKQYWRTRGLSGRSASRTRVTALEWDAAGGAPSLPWGLALVDAADIKPGMKLLKVDGKLPGEPGYPVR